MKAGLASLLNPLRLYHSHYHSMQMHIRRVCANDDCSDSNYELILTATTVFGVKKDESNLSCIAEY